MDEKKEKCKRCGVAISPKTKRAEFCSQKCKVYWWRMKRANDRLMESVSPSIPDYYNKQTNEIKPPKQPETNFTINMQRISELEEELKMIPDKTKGLGKKLAESINLKILKLKRPKS